MANNAQRWAEEEEKKKKKVKNKGEEDIQCFTFVRVFNCCVVFKSDREESDVPNCCSCKF